MRLLALLSLIFLAGCENETTESIQYEIIRDIDSGNYQAALNKLGDCETSSVFSKDECYVNRGMAYFGLAGYDITTIGEEIYDIYSDDSKSDDIKNIEIATKLLERFDNDYIRLGTREYKNALASRGKSRDDCTARKFRQLDEIEQQACIAINPIMTLYVMDDDFTSTQPVDMDELVRIYEITVGVSPELTPEDIAKLLNDQYDDLDEHKQDDIAAVECLVTGSCDGFEKRRIGEYKYSDDDILTVWRLDKWSDGFTTLKLTDDTGSVVLLDKNAYIREDNSTCTEEEYRKEYSMNCFPKPLQESLNSYAVEQFNSNEVFQSSVAQLVYIGDDMSDREKIIQLHVDMCGYPDCEITEDDIVKYWTGE
jgi:hypothetical protein